MSAEPLKCPRCGQGLEAVVRVKRARRSEPRPIGLTLSPVHKAYLQKRTGAAVTAATLDGRLRLTFKWPDIVDDLIFWPVDGMDVRFLAERAMEGCVRLVAQTQPPRDDAPAPEGEGQG